MNDFNKLKNEKKENYISFELKIKVKSKLEQNFINSFELIIEKLKVLKTYEAIEQTLTTIFNAQTIVWIKFPNSNNYYSPTVDLKYDSNSGIFRHFINSNDPLILKLLTDNKFFEKGIDDRFIPSNYSSIIFPIMNRDNSIVCIVQLYRTKQFEESNFELIRFLMKKFRLYSFFIFSPSFSISLALDLIEFQLFPIIITKLTSTLEKKFKCRKSEIWLNTNKKNIIFKFDPYQESLIPIDPKRSGVIGYCLQNCTKVLERSVRNHINYDQSIDGFYDEPILSMPYIDKENRCWAIILRGRANPTYFTGLDSLYLNTVTPYIIQSICASMSPPQFEAQLDIYEQQLSALLEVAEILTGVLDIDVLIPTIMERAIQLLKSERCSLFLVDQSKQELITRFHGGLSNEIRLPINRGIAGHTATTGQINNIEDAYLDNRFDRTIDIRTGYRTKSILCVPIYNNRGEIIGVTEMINKIDSDVFNKEDIQLLMAFNVFCGISLDNAKLYNASLDLARQLRTFVDLSTALGHKDTIRNILYQILENVSKIVTATRSSLYLNNNEDKNLTLLMNYGQSNNQTDIFALETLENQNIKIFVGEEISERLQKAGLMKSNISYLNNNNDESNIPNTFNRHSRISNLLDRMSTIENSNDINNNEIVICCIPLFNSEKKIFGIMEIECTSKILNEDLKLLDCFAVFASVSIERSQLIDVIKLGQNEIELKKWISEEERTKFNIIPKRFELFDPIIFKLSFDAQEWDGKLYNVIFSIFQKFNFFNEFKISNEKLFKFLYEIKENYKQVPYHNWRHAVDVTQFLTYQLLLIDAEKYFSKLELFGLIISSICHDVNHDGFTNVYNVKAETPLGILYKNQSVMETHHCQISIKIISKEECNIFSNLSTEDYKKIWSLIISLILATDMAKHFEILKIINGYLDSSTLIYSNQDHKLLLMQLLLKCSDISNAARPFHIADKWTDVLCEEFFKQGDLEQANGMEYTSPLNDRAHLDKPKSQIGFYNYVCLPLFQTIAKAFPNLNINVKQIQSNLKKWMES